MSRSELVDYIKISPNSTNPRNHKIDSIVIHHMAGNLSVESCGAVFAQASRQASSNYGIGSDGRVGLYVSEENRSWCSSNRDIDQRSITIEVANCSTGGEWPVSEKAYEKLIDLCVDICKRNGIPKLNFTGDRSGNLLMHKYYAATQCPGPYLEKRFPDIAQKVNERLGAEPVAKDEKKVDKAEETENVVGLPVLRHGSKGKSVQSLQILLIGYGYSCGSYGADGDFGNATGNALEKFQEQNFLDADRVCGPKTWAKILGV
jgi:N-acetyl-anhydromuramyl-L-alanine amidase AmpD